MEKIKNILRIDGGDRAVSPVIGVILMVAITVILAAVIGTFVLGLGDDIEQDVQAGATVQQDADNSQITITWTSQGTADGLAVTAIDEANDGDLITKSVGGNIVLKTSTIGEGISSGDSIAIVAFQGPSSITTQQNVLDNAERQTVIRTIEADFAISS